MSNLKGIVHQKNREIMTGRIAIGALLVICLVLCAIIFTAPSRLMIYNPPDLRAGCSRPQILRNITVKSEKSEILAVSHFKRLKIAKFEK